MASTDRRLPVNQLAILAVCRFAEPLALTSIFPYLPEMIESFGIERNEIAKWAGVASAIFSLSQCITAIAWGRASDRFGRKPIILLGLLNTMFTSLLWGFSTSLPMALVARALSGAGNGNVGIIRTMVAEMCPWRELQPRAFSIMPLVYNVGSVFGPSLGGALANPLHRKPGDPTEGGFFQMFPYALPNIVSSVFFLTGIVFGILYLHETLETKRDSRDYGLVLGQKLKAALDKQYLAIKDLFHKSDDPEREPLLNGSSAASVIKYEDEESSLDDTGTPPPKQKPPGLMEVLSRQSCMNLVVYTFLALHSIGYDQLLPVFMHHTVQDFNSPEVKLPFKFASGFDIDSGSIGVMFTLYGASNIFFQFLIFPPLTVYFGVLNCMKACSIVYPFVYFLTPFSALMPTTLSKQIVLFIIMLVKGMAGTFAFPCSTILLTNSANSVRILGTLNGIATSVSAIGRAAGPSICGTTFTLGVKHGFVIAPFWILSAISLVAAVPVFFLVEGKGFGDDPVDEEIAVEEGEVPNIDGDVAVRGLVPDNDEDADAENEEAYGGPGPLEPLSRVSTRSIGRSGHPGPLFRTSSAFSSAAATTEDEDDDLEAGGAAVGTSYGGTRGMQRSSSRPRLRRKSSVPLGMGVGFRRLSSNLGQSMSGYGPGNG